MTKEEFNDKKNIIISFNNTTLNEKKKQFIKTFDKLSKLYTEIYDEDSEFDISCRIAAGLGRIQSEVKDMKDEIEKDFDFRNLKFNKYHLVDDVDTNYRNVWFESDNIEDDSVHIYTPEFVNIDNVSFDDYKYIVIVEILRGCQHYKTLVLDAKTWIADTENLGVEQNYKDMVDYIEKQE